MASPTSIREAIARANLVLDEARAIQYTTPDSDGPFDGEDLEDPLLVSQLLLFGLERTFDLNDLQHAIKEVRAREYRSFARIEERRRRCRAKSSSLKLFRIANKAGNDINVLAESADCARFFAFNARHVREEKNAIVFQYGEKQSAELKISGSATGRAMREGIPGVLKSIGSGIVIEQAGKVYVPLTVIEPS